MEDFQRAQAKPSILIVDDESGWRDVLTSSLEEEFAIQSVVSYKEATEKMET